MRTTRSDGGEYKFKAERTEPGLVCFRNPKGKKTSSFIIIGFRNDLLSFINVKPS